MTVFRSRMLLFLVSSCLAFAVLESAARLAHRYQRYTPKIVTAEYLQPNPYLYRVLKPNLHTKLGKAQIDVNSLGFRGEEFSPRKPPGTYRIFVLGGSTTFGYPESLWTTEDTYPFKLQNELRSRLGLQTIEVINAGVPGYTLRTSLVNYATRITWLEPDLIIVYHRINDAILFKDGDDLYYSVVRADGCPSLWDRVSAYSFVLLELNFRWYKLRRGPAPLQSSQRSDEPSPITVAAYDRNLRSLVDMVRGQGVQVVVGNEGVVVPSNCSSDKNVGEDAGLRAFNKRACFQIQWLFPHLTDLGVKRTLEQLVAVQQRVAAERHLIWVDVDSLVPKTPEYYWDICHNQSAGSTLVAKALADRVAPLISERQWLMPRH